jgi:hypothetical protein
MTCREFQETLPEQLDSAATTEQQAHRQGCRECADLYSDLVFISQQARLLQDIAEPSPRIWNSIEIALRQEGLIRAVPDGPTMVPSASRRWRLNWLVPATAGLLLSFGVANYYLASHNSQPVDVAAATKDPSAMDADDAQMLDAVSLRAPAMRATYEANLQDVNAFIRDAKTSVDSNPGDEEARQLLMEAYAQKNMVYEMALDRSLR